MGTILTLSPTNRAIELLENRVCLACSPFQRIGCVPFLADRALPPLGNNLLPVCKHHSQYTVFELYRFPLVKQWLRDHDHREIVLEMERAYCMVYPNPEEQAADETTKGTLP